MVNIFNILSYIIKTEKFETTADTQQDTTNTMKDKIINFIFNFSLFGFLLLYLIKLDSYVPESYNMKTIAKIMASTYFVLSVIILISDIFGFFNL